MENTANVRINDLGLHHGSLEAATFGGCKCEVCAGSLKMYCNPNGVPACIRLPDHAGKCSSSGQDRTLDQLERELWRLNFSYMHRYYTRDIVRSYQS